MNVKVTEQSTAGPDEAVESLNLVHHLLFFRWLPLRKCGRDRTMHAISTHVDDVSDFSVQNPLMQFLTSATMTDHQANSALQILLICKFGEFKHLSSTRTICDDRLFHEDIQTLFNGVLVMHPSKRERRGQNHNVTGIQHIHGLLISVESKILVVDGYIDFLFVFLELLIDRVVASLQFVLKDVGHGHQFGFCSRRIQSVRRRTRPSTTTTDQCQLHRIDVRLFCMNVGNDHGSQRGRCRCRLNKLTAIFGNLRFICHRIQSPVSSVL